LGLLQNERIAAAPILLKNPYLVTAQEGFVENPSRFYSKKIQQS